VEQHHLGSLVYAGGDDVLAFLPIPEALAAADALRHQFTRVMQQALPALHGAALPTLSVGIGIGHIMEGMGELLSLGRSAEKAAKGAHLAPGNDRNAVAIVVDKRSGAPRQWRARWNEHEGAPVERLRKDMAALGNGLSSKKVYEVLRILRCLPSPARMVGRGQSSSSKEWARALRLEVKRCLDRAGDGPVSIEHFPELGGEEYGDVHVAVSSWVERLLIARTLLAAEPRARYQPQEVDQ